MKPDTSDERYDRQTVRVIEPAKNWNSLNISEIWNHRELFLVLTARDLKVRYSQTVLGIAWAVIQPVFAMIVFSIVFGRFAKMPSDGYPYPIFVYAALLPWIFFANTVTTAGMSLVGSTQLVNKVYLPRIIVPISSVGSGLVDFAMSSVILLMMMLYFGVGWSMSLFLAPLLIALLLLLALGVGILVAALTVSYRDFRYVVSFALQVWLFATPVVYPTSIVPDNWLWLWYLNPMTGLIEAFRSSFLGQEIDGISLLSSCIISIVIFIIGIVYFRKVEYRFADVI